MSFEATACHISEKSVFRPSAEVIDQSKERLDEMAAKAAEQIVSGAYLGDSLQRRIDIVVSASESDGEEQIGGEKHQPKLYPASRPFVRSEEEITLKAQQSSPAEQSTPNDHPPSSTHP
jgi:hypothetical protein